MRITARGLNRSTLARQLLLGRERLDVVDAVRRLVVLQAQAPASPYIALWNRLAGFDPGDLDAALASYAVVKSKLVRMTLHAHHADDYPAFRNAMQPSFRANGLNHRFAASGLTADDADALFAALLPFVDRPRTSHEIKGWLEERLGRPPESGVWRGVQHVAPLLHAPTGPPWSFGARTAFVAAGTPAAPVGPERCDEGLAVLARRYLQGFGPASVADVAQFAMVQRARARKALQALAGELERLEGPNGEELFDLPGAPRPDEDTPAPPRLMAMWDSVLLAYADRSRVLPPDYRRLVARVNGDVLPTLLVDGCVAGVWRPVEGGIEATAFHRLPAGAWEGLAAEARSLAAFLADREPTVYRRYDHWWSELSGAETRLLPGN